MNESHDLTYFYELRRDSCSTNCFIFTNKNDIVPISKILIRPNEIIGKDIFNSVTICIELNSIVRYDCVEDYDSFYIEMQKEHKILRDVCTTDNLNLNPSLIYKDIPIQEKIISLYLNKEFDKINLTEIKNLWKSKINDSCEKFILYVDSELSECNSDLYKEELNKIKTELTDIKNHKQLNSFRSKDKVLNYWPDILLPAPSFVKPK